MGDNPPSANDAKACPYCGEAIKAAAVVCRYCGRDLPPADPSLAMTVKPDAPIFRQETPGFVTNTPAPAPQVVYIEKKGGGCGGCMKVVGVISVIGGLLIFLVFALIMFNGSRHTPRISTMPLATPTMTVAQLQQAAVPIPWNMLARNTEVEVGRLMLANGRILQVLEDGSAAQLRVILDGDYDKEVLVHYPGYSKARVLENDNIRMIALINGRADIRTVMGKEMALPELTVQWLEVVKQ